ncbi:MAG TPA: hypothetical protein VNU68_23215 [Verrucomicrobiae bacterium]|nr:hypothetical protein [Verrucomicrobiae bacterium]
MKFRTRRCIWACIWAICFLGTPSLWAEPKGRFHIEVMTPRALEAFTPGGPPDQFPYQHGLYNGLIVSPGTFVPEQSGFFKFNVDNNGYFSGNMITGDYSTPLYGYFDYQGEVWLYIYEKEWDDCYCYYYLRHVWTVHMQVTAGSNEIEGSVYHVRLGWLSDLFGYAGRRSENGTAPENGRYTLRLPGSADPVTAPAGDGYGSVTVSTVGQVKISGKLADNASFSQSVTISTNGWWPFYVSFHDGRGSLIGWLNFSLQPDSDVAGDLFWAKPSRSDAQYYPDGFTGTIHATGARYSKPGSTETPLGWTNGLAYISGGNLLGPATNSVTMRPGNKFTDNGGGLGNLTFSLNTGTGVFKGKFTHPDTGKRMSYSGALHQLTAVGTGFFMDRDQGGFFGLQAVP